MSSSKLNNEIIEDYLEEDKPITGQKYVCLSFISPENVLDDKKTFYFYNYIKSVNSDFNKTYNEFKEDFRYFQEDNSEKLQEQFDDLVEYKTNVRGVKVRGVYDNIRAANVRAKVLQKLDRSFHVYVGQVGYWLPWDPTANNIEEQEYAEPELNRLVKEYKKNETKKDMFYEEQKREKQKAALEESIKLKKQQEEEKARKDEELRKLNELEVSTDTSPSDTSPSDTSLSDTSPSDTSPSDTSPTDTSPSDTSPTDTSPTDTSPSDTSPSDTSPSDTSPYDEVNTVSIQTTPKEEQTQLSSDNTVDEDLKRSLESVDPWLERKMEN